MIFVFLKKFKTSYFSKKLRESKKLLKRWYFKCSILVTKGKRRGELVRTCIFCVVHSNLFCQLFHHFCFPLGEGHGSQDSEVRGKTDEDKWKVETKVVNIKMLMVL